MATETTIRLEDGTEIKLRPIRELAEEHGVSYRTLSRAIYRVGVRRYSVPGYGRTVFIEAAEADRALQPQEAC